MGTAMILCKHCGKQIDHPRSTQQYCSNSCARYERVYVPTEYAYDKVVWSCGGGVQSTAIAALICQGRLPHPDYSLMIDVGRERTSTWEYVNNHLIPNLARYGVTLQILKTIDYCDTTLFSGTCFLLPAIRYRDGVRQKMTTMCNQRWKVNVQRSYMLEQGVESYENWIGISTDEARRARVSTIRQIRTMYPLIDMGLSRYGCLDLIKQMGWAIPPHTACWCCPNQSKEEWVEMRIGYPEDWRKVVELEREVRKKDPEIYFHSSCRPLEDVFA